MIRATLPISEAIPQLGPSYVPPAEFPCSGPVEEMSFLYAAVRHFGGPVLEQGAYEGGSTRVIHKALEDNGDRQKVYSVDVYHRLRDPEHYPFRVPVVGNARHYVTPEPVKIVFEDTDHTRVSTYQCLQQGMKSGARVYIVHDINAETLKAAPMALKHTCRAGALEFFEEHTELELFEISTRQGFFIAIHNELPIPFRGLGDS